MAKISVILCTNRENHPKYEDRFNFLKRNLENIDGDIFEKEFRNLFLDRFEETDHYLKPTLKSWEKQLFRDFELLIIHKNPEGINEILENYKINARVIKEKPSIWDKFNLPTLSNARNTGLMEATGNIIFTTDDFMFFNKNITKEIYNNFKLKRLVTFSSLRWIDFNPKLSYINYDEKMDQWQNKFVTQKGWSGRYNFVSNTSRISDLAIWGYGASFPRKEALDINGFEELLDGALEAEDIDFAYRIYPLLIRKYSRWKTKNLMYELRHEDDHEYRRDNLVNIRDNELMIELLGRNRFHDEIIKANKLENIPKIFYHRYVKNYKKKHGKYPNKLWDYFRNNFESYELRENGN